MQHCTLRKQHLSSTRSSRESQSPLGRAARAVVTAARSRNLSKAQTVPPTRTSTNQLFHNRYPPGFDGPFMSAQAMHEERKVRVVIQFLVWLLWRSEPGELYSGCLYAPDGGPTQKLIATVSTCPSGCQSRDGDGHRDRRPLASQHETMDKSDHV